MELPRDWEVIEGRLMAEFKFKDFQSAKTFVDLVSQLSESHNHHPDIHFGWGYVVLELFTHDAEKITEKDYNLASEISENHSMLGDE
jgi:4a-hydroxytetrahydrobiopterin dehydratase|tara:strand:+ start:1502 stop:1762 length:261 start_codon:yes stop_codon:yes gene_type:complete